MEMPENFLEALLRLLSNRNVEDVDQAEALLRQFFEELNWRLEDDFITDIAEHLIDHDHDPASFETYWEKLRTAALSRGVPHLVQDPDTFRDVHELNIDPDEIVDGIIDQLVLPTYEEVE